MLATLLRHLVWADRRTADSLDSLAHPSHEVLRTWGHLLGAEATWLARIEGFTSDVGVWPELDLGAARVLMAVNHATFLRLADATGEALAVRVEYRNSAGEAYANPISEILHHVALHGMYHRGQVALEVRRQGGTPIGTDLITYLRERP